MKDHPTTAVIPAITELQKEGCPVANHPEELAGIAVRRWFSSERRGVKQSDLDARIRERIGENGMSESPDSASLFIGVADNP
jgi:hypothetical protein